VAAVTGEIIDFGGGGRKPPNSDPLARIKAAKANIPEHDPHQDLLDALAAFIQFVGPGHPAAASALDNEQVKLLVYNTERAAERGVSMYAKRVASWHQAIVGGAFVAGLTIGIMGTFYTASRQHAAEIEAMRLAVPGVLSAIPAADLAEWTQMIRLNDISKAQRTCIPQAGGTACSIALWTKAPTAGKN
jgi:PII-like signaling protein